MRGCKVHGQQLARVAREGACLEPPAPSAKHVLPCPKQTPAAAAQVSNQLTGTLSAMSNLTALRSLEVSHNHLSGTVPADWLSSYHLRMFSIAYNSFEGTLPGMLLPPCCSCQPCFACWASPQRADGNVCCRALHSDLRRGIR